MKFNCNLMVRLLCLMVFLHTLFSFSVILNLNESNEVSENETQKKIQKSQIDLLQTKLSQTSHRKITKHIPLGFTEDSTSEKEVITLKDFNNPDIYNIRGLRISLDVDGLFSISDLSGHGLFESNVLVDGLSSNKRFLFADRENGFVFILNETKMFKIDLNQPVLELSQPISLNHLRSIPFIFGNYEYMLVHTSNGLLKINLKTFKAQKLYQVSARNPLEDLMMSPEVYSENGNLFAYLRIKNGQVKILDLKKGKVRDAGFNVSWSTLNPARIVSRTGSIETHLDHESHSVSIYFKQNSYMQNISELLFGPVEGISRLIPFSANKNEILLGKPSITQDKNGRHMVVFATEIKRDSRDMAAQNEGIVGYLYSMDASTGRELDKLPIYRVSVMSPLKFTPLHDGSQVLAFYSQTNNNIFIVNQKNPEFEMRSDYPIHQFFPNSEGSIQTELEFIDSSYDEYELNIEGSQDSVGVIVEAPSNFWTFLNLETLTLRNVSIPATP